MALLGIEPDSLDSPLSVYCMKIGKLGVKAARVLQASCCLSPRNPDYQQTEVDQRYVDMLGEEPNHESLCQTR